MDGKTGALFIVATPIGNLADITRRAVTTLARVELILAEDTRRASILLNHLNIGTPTHSLHKDNEAAKLSGLLHKLVAGAEFALISDAGTPLISDPGYLLVRRAREEGVSVIPIPGASAVIAALSASGQAANQFCFEGFLPAKTGARERHLLRLQQESRTLVFYESAHRIGATLEAMATVFGADRELTVAREITKKFETFYSGTVATVSTALLSAPKGHKGEFVIVVSGLPAERVDRRQMADNTQIMRLLMSEMSLTKASKIAAQITNQKRNELYTIGLNIKD